MKSEYLEMKQRHDEEHEALRKNCKHDRKFLKKRLDHSCVGAGCCVPAVVIICRNCGTDKIIFNLEPKQRQKVKMTLKRQGFKDERLDGYARYTSDFE